MRERKNVISIYNGRFGQRKDALCVSDCIAKSLENEKENYIVIVPEQQTMQTQKDW